MRSDASDSHAACRGHPKDGRSDRPRPPAGDEADGPTAAARRAERRARRPAAERPSGRRRRSTADPSPSAAADPGRGRRPSRRRRIEVEDLNVYYGAFRAVKTSPSTVKPHAVTAIIGPSGCGKSTFLRTLNRMHELTPNARIEGTSALDGDDIYDPDVDPVQLRRVVGMVFQRPNPFPTMSIYDNVVAGPPADRPARRRPSSTRSSSGCLRRAALWDEVKDKLGERGTSLSGGQQQRLCIARALAVEPEVILMDEPASALDPVATLRIEELMAELRANYTIVIVTHNMQQASRVSDRTAFFTMGDDRAGYLVEMDDTTEIFTNPDDQLTEDYVRAGSAERGSDTMTDRHVTTDRRPPNAERRSSDRARGRARVSRCSARPRDARPRGAADQGRGPADGLARRGGRSAPASRPCPPTTPALALEVIQGDA